MLLAALILAACAAPTPASLPASQSPLPPTQPPTTPPTQPSTSLPASPTPEPPGQTTRPFEYVLATPASQEPAAGICMEAEGDTAVAEIFPDVPAPRCLKVTPGQRLVVINRTDSEISVSLGALSATLQPGQETSLDRSFDEYLEPGVHRLQASPYSGPEVWLTGD